MRSRSIFTFAVVLLVSVAGAFAHPHYSKTVEFQWDRNDSEEGRTMTVGHITVPYNEIKAGNLPVGERWHCGFANFETGVDLVSGETAIVKGAYKIQVLRKAEEDWSLELVRGEGDEKVTLELDGAFEKDLPLERHLQFDIHVGGEKDETGVAVVVRFGPYGVQFPVALAD